jgi:hypothetical protein
MAPNRREISWLITHEIQFPKYAAYYAFAEDTCKKNLQSRTPHGDNALAVTFSTRLQNSLARKIFKYTRLSKITAYSSTLPYTLADVLVRQTMHSSRALVGYAPNCPSRTALEAICIRQFHAFLA